MKRGTLILIIPFIFLTISVDVIEAAVLKSDCVLQQNDEDEKDKKKDKVKKTDPTLNILEPYNKESHLKLTFEFKDDDLHLVKKSSPPAIDYLSLKFKLPGFTAFFGGPVNRTTADPILDNFLGPVFSLNKDPVSRKFWWE